MDIPGDSVVVGVPGRILHEKHPRVVDEIEHLKHGELPDPVLSLIKSLETRLAALEQKIPQGDA